MTEGLLARRWVGVLMGLGLFGGIMLLQAGVGSNSALSVGLAFGLSVSVGLSLAISGVVKRQPRWIVAGGSVGLIPAIFMAHGAALALVVAAFATLGALGWFLNYRKQLRKVELDRLLFSESSSVAFFVTMIGVLCYAMLESMLDLPELKTISVVVFGVWAQLIAYFVIERRYK